MDHIVRLDSRQEAALHAIADKFVATHEGDVIAGRVRPTHRLGNTGSPRRSLWVATCRTWSSRASGGRP